MCGLAGIVAWEDRYHVARPVLEKMSARLAHRGPDGQGIWLNHDQQATPDRPRVGLAHRRLAILDPEPRADQPFTDGHGRWIVFNGEIYNFRELRGQLSTLHPDAPWRTQGDTEVLLRAYAAWAEHCVEHLNGMFAFAVWDESAQTLFLARDPMGQKPLYVTCPCVGRPMAANSLHFAQIDKQPVVAFASELAALRELPWLNTQVSPPALRTYLSLGYIPDHTIYRGVVKLQPSTWVRFAPDAITTNQYFQPRGPRSIPTMTDDAARQTTRQLIESAVRRQLVADVPLGCFLSGGRDSSVIAAAMRAAAPSHQPVLTFSMGIDDPRYDESAFAQRVADHLGTTHHRFICKPDAAADLPKLAEVFGEPFADSSALPTHYLAQQTRNHVKVALSGDGGDELFGGYDRYRAMQLWQRWPWLASLARPLRRLPSAHPKSRLTRMKRWAASAHLPPAQRYASYMRLFDFPLLRRLLNPDLLETADRGDNLAAQYAADLGQRDLVTSALALDRVTYLPEDLLTKVDRASMLHALEVRSPFMDPDLVTFASSLTTPQLLAGGPKRMLREAFAADLPPEVFRRPKMGFALPIAQWFRGELHSMLHDALFAADSFTSQHLQCSVLRHLLDEHQRGLDHAQRLYALLMLELWWKGR